LLNQSKLNYIITWNINSELPSSLKVGKDIDILIKKNDEKKYINFFHSHNYQTTNHPFKYDIFLYGVDRFEYKYMNKDNNIDFDVVFQLAVRSLDAGQFIPLDQTIQDSAWKNKRFERLSDDFGYWTLSYEDELVCLTARAIFDKREFKSGYIKRINELLKLIDKTEVLEKLNMIFFKYTPYLFKYIEDRNYNEIIKNYLMFKEY
jgi:hypothetical protein